MVPENSSRTTHPVGQKRSNAWGLYDMYGNLYEWCADWHGEGEEYYKDDEETELVTASYRVFRGGCWSSPAPLCRSAFRFWFQTRYRYHFMGFRVVLDLMDQVELPCGGT